MKRLLPHGIEPSDSDGDILTTVGGVATWGTPVPPDFLVTVTDGVPSLTFDDDGQVVYTEGT